jgi:hypothetical protein
MAESTPNADATSDASATPAGVAEAVPAPTADELGDTGTRALAALRRELKEAKTERDALAAEKRAAEDADRSELDLVKRENDELKATAARVLKMEAAIEAGIPTQWMRLNGSTADELKADAKAFAASLGKTDDSNGGSGATPADLGAGPRPGTPATGRDGFNAAIRAKANR